MDGTAVCSTNIAPSMVPSQETAANHIDLQRTTLNIYRPQRSCGKVMFLHLSVSHFVHRPPPPRRQKHTPLETVIAADGTHPTGMHSCCDMRVTLVNTNTNWGLFRFHMKWKLDLKFLVQHLPSLDLCIGVPVTHHLFTPVNLRAISAVYNNNVYKSSNSF